MSLPPLDVMGHLTAIRAFDAAARLGSFKLAAIELGVSDPEAAEMVFASGMPITMIGWDISSKYAVIDDAEAASLRQIGTPQARAAVDCQANLRRFCQDTGLAGFDLPDPIAVAVALDDSVATQSFDAAVFVSTHDGLTRGQTILDDRAMTERPPTVRVVSAANRERFMAVLRQGLS